MKIGEKFKIIRKHFKFLVAFGGSTLLAVTLYHQTCNSLNKIVNTNVLDREKKSVADFMYIDDPSYRLDSLKARSNETDSGYGWSRLWKSFKHSWTGRLLWVCRYGSPEQRNIALTQLASFRRNKAWDCLKVAQALDSETSILLARTEGVDTRYFLPPPIHIRRAAKSPELLSFKFRDLLLALQGYHTHSCITHFLSKYFTNVHEEIIEVDNIPIKPDSVSEHDLCISCLDVIYHHLNIFYVKEYSENQSATLLVNMGLLSYIAELLLRYRNDSDVDLGVLKILKLLSIHTNLAKDFFVNGLVGELARLVQSKDVRLSSSAAVCLANLSGEECYGPGLYLLHPVYRTTKKYVCDTLLVHGLRGGVFVTWRQRDESCSKPLGIVEVASTEDNCEAVDLATRHVIPDPELRQVMEDIMEMEDEALLLDYEVVLHDVPVKVLREPVTHQYIAVNKRTALEAECEDKCHYSFCWPKDWLPKDCANLRILGVNYWSNLSEWLERCPLQNADIVLRASKLAPVLLDAGVGIKKPIVWLSHSMGGLIVKQILVSSAHCDNETAKMLCENTKAILFYSTPHKGSALAKMPRAAAAILWPSADVRQLEENSPILLQLHKDFNKLADKYDWDTISFAETNPTLVTAFKVPVHFVPTLSADLGRGAYYEMPLDHLSICKPATRQSLLYTAVIEVLNKVEHNEATKRRKISLFYWLLSLFWSPFRSTSLNIEGMDDTSAEGMRWFEKIAMSTFVDD